MQNMQKKCRICRIREICRICKISKICIKCKTCKIFLFQKILIFLLLRSSYFSFSLLHLINHEVQNPLSPFNLADLFSPRIWSSFFMPSLTQAIHDAGMGFAREDGRYERGPGWNSICNGEDIFDVLLTARPMRNIGVVKVILRLITIMPRTWPPVEKLWDSICQFAQFEKHEDPSKSARDILYSWGFKAAEVHKRMGTEGTGLTSTTSKYILGASWWRRGT